MLHSISQIMFIHEVLLLCQITPARGWLAQTENSVNSTNTFIWSDIYIYICLIFIMWFIQYNLTIF